MKNQSRKKSIIFVRSNEINYDSRINKEIESALENGFTVKVLGWSRNKNLPSRETKKHKDFTYEIIRFRKKSEYGSGAKNIPKLIQFQFFIFLNLFKEKNNFKIIHCADFDTALTSYFFSKFFNKKIIYDIYDFYSDAFKIPFLLKPLIRKLDVHLINNADAIILTSEYRVNQIKPAKPKKITYIHNTPNFRNLENSLEKLSHRFTISYIGVLQEDRLLKEMIEIFKIEKNWILHIAGFGPLENYIQEASDNYPNINFYGSVEYNEGINISSMADLLVATYNPKIKNHKYSTPNKFYEALYLGKKIIVCKNTGIDEVVLENSLGWVIDYSQKSLHEILKKISLSKIDSTEERERIKKIYNEKYSWDIMEKRLVNLYNTF